jgi:hypothetical protein
MTSYTCWMALLACSWFQANDLALGAHLESSNGFPTWARLRISS